MTFLTNLVDITREAQRILDSDIQKLPNGTDVTGLTRMMKQTVHDLLAQSDGIADDQIIEVVQQAKVKVVEAKNLLEQLTEYKRKAHALEEKVKHAQHVKEKSTALVGDSYTIEQSALDELRSTI